MADTPPTPDVTPVDAFLLGYLPELVGAHFDALSLHTQAKAGAGEALSAVIADAERDLPRRGPAISSCIYEVERIIGDVLHEAPPRAPRSPAEQVTWSETLQRHAGRLVSLEPSGIMHGGDGSLAGTSSGIGSPAGRVTARRTASRKRLRSA